MHIAFKKFPNVTKTFNFFSKMSRKPKEVLLKYEKRTIHNYKRN